MRQRGASRRWPFTTSEPEEIFGSCLVLTSKVLSLSSRERHGDNASIAALLSVTQCVRAIKGLAAGAEEVFPDAVAKDLAGSFKADWKAVEKNIARMMVPAPRVLADRMGFEPMTSRLTTERATGLR